MQASNHQNHTDSLMYLFLIVQSPPPPIIQTLTTDPLNMKPIPLGKTVEQCTFHR